MKIFKSLLIIVFFLWKDMNFFHSNQNEVLKKAPNQYQKKTNYKFVQNTDNFTVLSKNDIRNVFYTIVNNGWKEFSFYCPKEYIKCQSDVSDISQDQDLLTHINNFVHPYNGFSNIHTKIDESGQINISVTYFYNEDHIEAINKKVDDIYNEIITDDMDTRTKIKTIHDYIINNTKYDINRNEGKDSLYQSYLAYGPLFQGYGTCNGYTDTMALFLEKMNIPNFKVAMTPEDVTLEGHVWNAVFLDNQWLHLDLTWDDPVSNDGKDYLSDKYFLITTEELENIDLEGNPPVTDHNFKKNIYLEFKK